VEKHSAHHEVSVYMRTCECVRHNASFPALRLSARRLWQELYSVAAASSRGVHVAIWSRRIREPRQRDKLNDPRERATHHASHPFD
jgi:hypothetical protein